MKNPTSEISIDSDSISDQPKFWVFPFSSQRFEIGILPVRLWIVLQVGLTLIGLPILILVVMEFLIDLGWVRHSDNFADLNEFSLATFGFFALRAIGSIIVASIPLPASYRIWLRVLLRSLLFVISFVLFWPVLFVVQIIFMLCTGSGFS